MNGDGLVNAMFNISGTFTVSFACTDALWTTDLSPAIVRVTVNVVNAARSSGGGGGGGGCTLRPGGQIGLTALVDILGNVFLPMLVLGVIRMLSRANRPYHLR